MFSIITWEIFIITSLLLTAGYYSVTTLLLFHKEIVQWFKPRSKTSSEAANSIHFKIPQSGPVMGDIALEDKTAANRVTEINLEDVAIGQPENEDEPDTIIPSQNSVTGKGDPLIASVADLLYEIKTLVDLIAEYSSDKAETVSLFKALLLRYPHLRGTMYQQVVNHYLSEASKSQFSFDLPLAEVITWWEAETSPGK